LEVTKEQLVAELNKDVEWEYAALIQYVQHAALITGPQFEGIQKELIIHAQEELQHAVTVAEQIDFLGGVPVLSVEHIDSASGATGMLQNDLKGEEVAIARYKRRIAQAEALKEYGLRRLLEDILMQEEEHKRDLMMALGK